MLNTGTTLRRFMLIALFSVTLIGCSSSGDEAAPEDPATSSNWDQMQWDKGTWSN